LDVWDKDPGDVWDDVGAGDVRDMDPGDVRDIDPGDVWDDFEADDISPDTSYPPGEDYNEVSASGCSDKHWWCRYYSYDCCSVAALSGGTSALHSKVIQRLDDSIASLTLSWPAVGAMVSHYHPVFDFTSDSCFPDAAVDRFGIRKHESGTKSLRTLTDGCRSNVYLRESNTYHRWTSATSGWNTYHAHIFELYFEKDRQRQGAIRNGVETVIMYFKNGIPTHVAVSAHETGSGQVWWNRWAWSDVPLESGRHPKIVYFLDYDMQQMGLEVALTNTFNTHSFRFANPRETAQNTEGRFVLPSIASWDYLRGDLPYDTPRLQSIINSISSFELKIADSQFLPTVNSPRPAGYPVFT